MDPTIATHEYIYEPITSDSTTRMLVLHNGDYEDELTGDLEMTRLNDESATPWEALSYAWGTPQAYSRIKIGDNFIKISANLGDALKRLRNKGGVGTLDPGRRLWVDQICINQEDIPERSQQVQLMFSIYDKAKEVKVWLGPDPFMIAKKTFFTLRLIASMNYVQLIMLREEDPDALEPLLGGLSNLFRLPWFSRLWVVQEVGTMTPATFCWGQECIDFLTLYKASCAFSDHLFKAAQHFGIRGFYGRALYQSFVEGHQENPFRKKDFAFQLYWLNKGIPHQCLDPRDRVFALLGHYSARIGTDRRLIMKADYSLTKADVYQEIAIRALTYAKSTFLLHAVHHIDQIPVPSWVPDWDSKSRFRALRRPDFDWSGVATDMPLVTQVIKPQNTLQIQGFVFDTVDSAARTFGLNDVGFRTDPHLPSRTTLILMQIWNDICGHGVFTMLANYHALGSSALVAFLDTCSVGWALPFYVPEPSDYSAVMTPTSWVLDGISHLRRILPSGSIDVTSIPVDEGDADLWETYFRRFAKTTDGYYALCPELAEEGDVVAVLMGHETPFILRPTGDDFLLVGECYVHGIMQGQALTKLERGEAVLRDFNIL